MNRATIVNGLLQKITSRRAIAGLALLAVVGALLLLWPERSGLKVSSVSVHHGEDGIWYTTLLLTNELDASVNFEWLESEDRDLADKHAERFLFYDATSYPSAIGPHESVTYPRRLPLPGAARRFRLRYHTWPERESRLERLLREIFPANASRPRGRIAASPEVSADDALRQ